MEVGRVNQLFNPEIYIPKRITDINHINNNLVKNCPLEESAAKYICPFIDKNIIIVGYNVGFDIKFVSGTLKKYGYRFEYLYAYDVLPLARELLAERVPNHKLGVVAEYFNVNKGLEFHNSLDDVIATKRVMIKLLSMYINLMKK